MKSKKYLNFNTLKGEISKVFKGVTDFRQSSKVEISLHDVLMSGFACMHFQDPSLLQFQERLESEEHQNNLKTMFGVEKIPKETQMRDTLDDVNSNTFRPIFKNVMRILQRNKYLEDYAVFDNKYYFALDGSQFHGSKKIHCEHCLVQKHKDHTVTYSHKVVQGSIVHPDCKEVIPFMPEQIANTDGSTKQDCEMNAAKRLIQKLRQDYPKMKFIIGGDALYSKQPIIREIQQLEMDFLFVAKPSDHKYLFQAVDESKDLQKEEFIDAKGIKHVYEWVHDVSLTASDDAVKVNFLRYKMIEVNKDNKEEILYSNTWVTNLTISSETCEMLVRLGRSRWKVENEILNVMKNHGYCMDRNYGHGKKNLAFNFYLLTLLAFSLQQILQRSDRLYQACRLKFGSKRHFWETLRAYIKIIIFKDWDSLLHYALKPVPFKYDSLVT